ncbi:hypothetical protein THAOC_32703, partial [Thalassiosira oceanica]
PRAGSGARPWGPAPPAVAGGLVPLPVLPHEEAAPAEVRAVERRDRVLRLLGRGVLDRAAPLRASVGQRHDFDVHDLAGLAHVVLEVLPRHVVREVTHVNAAARAVRLRLSARAGLGAGRSGLRPGVHGILPVLPDEYLAPGEVRVVELADRPERRFGRLELDYAAPLRPAVGEREDLAAYDRAASRHVLVEALGVHAPREVSHEEALRGRRDGLGGLRRARRRCAFSGWFGGESQLIGESEFVWERHTQNLNLIDQRNHQ